MTSKSNLRSSSPDYQNNTQRDGRSRSPRQAEQIIGVGIGAQDSTQSKLEMLCHESEAKIKSLRKQKMAVTETDFVSGPPASQRLEDLAHNYLQANDPISESTKHYELNASPQSPDKQLRPQFYTTQSTQKKYTHF